MIIARRSGAGWRIALWVEDDLGPSVVTGIEVLIARWSLSSGSWRERSVYTTAFIFQSLCYLVPF
jgi:hypothetical protein